MADRSTTIRVAYDIDQPPEKVWRALTEPDLLSAWLMENDIRPQVGHRFTFRTDPAPGFDGIVHCEVLLVEPRERLRYSWRGGPLDTVVTWTLTPKKDGGTLLQLEHDGFTAENASTFDILSNGWRSMKEGALKRVIAEL